MAYSALIIGPSGSGKTYSGYTLDPKSTIFICPEKKELPFRGFSKNYKTLVRKDQKDAKGQPTQRFSVKGNFIPENRMKEIKTLLKAINDNRTDVKVVVIDTFTYAMLKSVEDRLFEDNWDKFKQFALEFKDLVDFTKTLRKDLVIIVTAHDESEESKSTADAAAKRSFKVPSGRFTKEAMVPEGLFTVVLWTEVAIGEDEDRYYFRTNGDANTTVKSPPGMFPEKLIPNNLDYVVKCIIAYYNDEETPILN